MDGDDRPEDGDDAAGYLPPDQRWWRHPSELSPRAPALMPASGGSRAALVLVAVIGAAGAVLAAYITHLARPATDETATRSTAIRLGVSTSSLVTLATVAPASSAVEGVVQLLVPSGGSTRTETAAVVGEGHLVTSANVVAGVKEVTVVMADGSKQPATVVWLDRESGTAVLDIAEPTPTLAGGQAATLGAGDRVTAAGTANSGKVEKVGVEATADDGSHMAHLLQVRMEHPVDDGAVLLDRHGRAVGICVGHLDGDDAATLAAPIELARAASDATDQDGEHRLAWLGITGRSARPSDVIPVTSTSTAAPAPTDSTPDTAGSSPTTSADGSSTTAEPTTSSAHANTSTVAASTTTDEPSDATTLGAFVASVTSGSPAEAAGLRRGDVVVALDGVPVRSMNALILLVRERKIGGHVYLTVSRDGQTIVLDAVLQDRTAQDQSGGTMSSTTPNRT